MRRHSEYPTLSKLVNVTSRNLFAATELDSEPDKNAAFHYSYNLRHEADGNSAERNSEGSSVKASSRGDKHSMYAGNTKDRFTDRHWRYSGVNSTPRRQENAATATGRPAGGNRDGADLSLESKIWSSALSRDSKFYSRQYSEPGESNNRLVKTTAMTSMRHNSLPGGRFPSLFGERQESPTRNRQFEPTKRRKRGICDDTDGSHYQRQFLRVLKKRF